MTTKIQKWGNSQGVRIPKNILSEAGVEIGQEIEFVVKEGGISLYPKKKIRGRYKIEELVSKLPKELKNQEIEWGSPQGREVW